MNQALVPMRGGRPAWHYAAGIGPTWHGLEFLGARDLAEANRMGFDIEYYHHAPAGAEIVVDVYHARIVVPIPAPAAPSSPQLSKLPAPVGTGPGLANLPPLSDEAWPATWAMKLANLRHDWLIELRREVNRSRARWGLLSADIEDSILNDGGYVVGAVGYDRTGRPIAAGTAATPEQRRQLLVVRRG